MRPLVCLLVLLSSQPLIAQPPVITPDTQPIIINIPPPVIVQRSEPVEIPPIDIRGPVDDTARRLDAMEKQLAAITAMLKERENKPEEEIVLYPQTSTTIEPAIDDLSVARQLIKYYNSKQRVGISGSINSHMVYHGVPASVYTHLSPEDNLRLHSVIHHYGNTWRAAVSRLLPNGNLMVPVKASSTGCANGQCVRYYIRK